MAKFGLGWGNLKFHHGEVAKGFMSPGCGAQLELPLPVDMLVKIKFLKEI